MAFNCFRARPSRACAKSLLTTALSIGLLSSCVVVQEEPGSPAANSAPQRDTNQPKQRPTAPQPPPNAQVNQAGKRIKVVYYPVKGSFPKAMQQIYQKTQIFERLSAIIDNDVKLPREVKVEMAECGFENAFYEPAKHRIVMCYELTQYFINLYRQAGLPDRQAGENALYATVFTFFHESGHMLANELQLPITGKEEDAADQFSTLVLATRAGDAGEKAAEAAALWFGIADSPATRTRFMDEHSLDQQRFYSIMCLLYGDNPRKYERSVTKLGFPDARKAKCQREYQQVTRAWKALLAPYVRNRTAS